MMIFTDLGSLSRGDVEEAVALEVIGSTLNNLEGLIGESTSKRIKH